MKQLVIILMTLLPFTVSAQNMKGQFSVKPMTGINVTTYSRSQFKDMFHAKVRWNAGLEGEYGVSDWLGVSLGIIYSEEGAKGDHGDRFLNEFVEFTSNNLSP